MDMVDILSEENAKLRTELSAYQNRPVAGVRYRIGNTWFTCPTREQAEHNLKRSSIKPAIYDLFAAIDFCEEEVKS